MRLAKMHVTPIALGDPPLLNAAGLHAPYALRTVVELVTEDGISGLAEVPGSLSVDALLNEARAVVLGADPLNWHALKARLETYFQPESSAARGDAPWDQRKVVQVFSALDVACLDIAGKAFGVPVATLLGGVVREKVPYSAYLFYKYEGAGGVLEFGTDPNAKGWDAARQRPALDADGIVDQARAMVAEFGFRSLKLKGGVFEPEIEVQSLRALRSAFGPEVPIRYDPNALWTVETAIRYGKELEDVLEYFEDPVRGQQAMAEVRRSVKLPFATNMCTTSFADLPGSVLSHSEDIILTDHHYWGGLHSSMELAAFCRSFGRGISMHSNNHAGISMAAMTHLGAAMPNLSYALDTHYPWQWEEIIIGGRLPIEDGCVSLPKGPGLGVELDRPALARAHESYLRCGLAERDDQVEMRKKVPEWTFKATRW
jgi:glucarate dehydratase